MKKQKLAFLLIAITIISFSLVLIAQQRSQPSYLGRPLGLWLDVLVNAYQEKASPQAGKEAEEAVNAIGTNAIPELLKLMRTSDPSMRKKFNELLKRQSLVGFRFQYQEDIAQAHLKAALGFRVLGLRSRAARPELAQIFFQTETIESAAIALKAIGPDSVPVFRAGLTNQNGERRLWSVWSLRDLGSNAATALPELIRVIQDTSEKGYIRQAAVRVVGGLKSEWKELVPVLITCLDDPQVSIKALEALGEFGTNAAMADSAIKKALTDTNQPASFRKMAVDVLQKIKL